MSKIDPKKYGHGWSIGGETKVDGKGDIICKAGSQLKSESTQSASSTEKQTSQGPPGRRTFCTNQVLILTGVQGATTTGNR